MFWDKFYEQCIEKTGKKPNALREQFNVSSGVITKWKNGGIPNGETLIRIADYLNCSTDYLLGREQTISNATDSENQKIIKIYSSLNDEGREKVIDYAELISSKKEFTND